MVVIVANIKSNLFRLFFLCVCFSGWLQHNVLGSKRGYIRLPSEWWVDNTFLFLGNFLHIFHFYPLHFKHIRLCISNSERWGCLQIFIRRVQFGICAQLHLTAVDTCFLNLWPCRDCRSYKTLVTRPVIVFLFQATQLTKSAKGSTL